MRNRLLPLIALALLGLCSAQTAAATPKVSAAQAAGSAADYAPCGPLDAASLVEAARTSCEIARGVAATLLTAPPDGSVEALARIGWRPLRAQQVDGGEHDLVALRGLAAVRVRRPGPAPDLDGWAAGRELIFARGRIVGGRPVPRGAAVCTSAFLVRLGGGRQGGLSAAHCAGLRRDRRVQRRNSALRRPPAPGIVLGAVQRILTRRAPLDALLVPIPSGPRRTSNAVVERGIDVPPWAVTATARPKAGRVICFTGRTSGADLCGRIARRSLRRAERALSRLAGLTVRCTTIPARQGDSGGPVYTAPRPDGTVRAVGIVTLVVGPDSVMCFTPLTPVLRRLDARLVTVG